MTLRARLVQPEGETLRLVTAAVLLLTILGGTVLGLRPGSHAPRFAMAGFAGIGVLLSVLSGGEGVVSPFWSGTSCATTQCLVALIPMALSVVLLSRFEFDLWRTLVAGMSAAGVDLLALSLHCENGAWQHLLMFHALPSVLLVLVVLAVRRSLPSETFAP